jgi:serine/threonine-protein phosphatase PGAM5
VIARSSPRRAGTRRLAAALWTLAGLAGVSFAGVAALAVAAEPGPAQGARTLYLVRHGNYDRSDPRPENVGKGLVPIGVAQARLVGSRLRADGLRFDAFDSSPLTRARETAALVAEELGHPPVKIDPLLEECTPPTRRRAAVADEKAEDLAACKARLDLLFARRFQPSPEGDRRELIVAHGNLIRYLVTRALGVDPEAWLEMSIGHASLTVIRIEADGSFRVLSVGDVGHLPAGLRTGAAGDPERDLAIPK